MMRVISDQVEGLNAAQCFSLPLMPDINYSKFQPVVALSLKGRMLIHIIRSYYRMREWMGLRLPDTVIPGHHEDPLTMTFEEKRYMGHKYYYRAMLRAEQGSDLENHFGRQHFDFPIPSGFEPGYTATLSAGGDLIPYTCVRNEQCAALWDETGDFFFGADMVLANLESPANFTQSFSAAPEVMLHDMFFNTDEEAFRIFNGNGRYRGFDVLSVANNHSLDKGVAGLQHTLDMLQQKGIAACGAVSKPEDLLRPVLLERNGIRMAFVSATFSFNKEKLPKGEEWRCNKLPLNKAGADMQLLVQQVKAARGAGADWTVAVLHMGCAYQAYPSLHTVNNIHALCDASGVDMVIAGHPHHAQPMEIYASPVSGKRHFIAYSLGDFIAFDIFKWGRLCLMPKFTLVKGTLNGTSHTCLSGIQLKAGYMHAKVSGGKVRSLKLLDYVRVKNSPESYLNTSRDKKLFAEVSDFFERFVLSPDQQAELGLH